jgi:hypothetical protein
MELMLDRQTKLDEWSEYSLYEHRKRRTLEKKRDQVERQLELMEEGLGRLGGMVQSGFIRLRYRGAPQSLWGG